ncbi:hypothetical protein [Chitinimonas lacunae]|uniref:SPW repeat-containing protein n=1 Tax=Chitinimonas lacunae TaxID=1963018 RepID=A0ABV8MMA6_9NEIS
MRNTAFPAVLIVIGSLWLLAATDLLPTTSVLVSVGLVAVGVVQLLLDGVNKSTVVAAPMWMLSGGLFYGIAQRSITLSVAGAIAMIVLGLLLLLARLPAIPERRQSADGKPSDGTTSPWSQ